MTIIRILKLVDDRGNRRQTGNHFIERGQSSLGHGTGSMGGDTLRREILGECQVHCLGVIVEENLDNSSQVVLP